MDHTSYTLLGSSWDKRTCHSWSLNIQLRWNCCHLEAFVGERGCSLHSPYTLAESWLYCFTISETGNNLFIMNFLNHVYWKDQLFSAWSWIIWFSRTKRNYHDLGVGRIATWKKLLVVRFDWFHWSEKKHSRTFQQDDIERS